MTPEDKERDRILAYGAWYVRKLRSHHHPSSDEDADNLEWFLEDIASGKHRPPL